MPKSSNAPEPITGFGKLGKFCRDILAYVKSIHIDDILIQEETNVGIPPKAQIQPSPKGTRIILRMAKGTGLPDLPTDDGTYVLGVVIEDGTGAPEWFTTDVC